MKTEYEPVLSFLSGLLIKEIERRNKVKDRINNDVAHELKTPLTSILLCAQFLQRLNTDPEKIKKGLEMIERSAKFQKQKIDAIIEDIVNACDGIDMIETSMVLYDDKLMVSLTKGKEGEVEFDFEEVWRSKNQIPNFDPSKLTWLHVHPSGFGCRPSYQDYLCALSLRMAFKELGKFGIFHFHTPSLSDVRGQVAWYELADKELRMLKTEAIEENHLLKGPAMVLKLHSFSSSN